MDILVKLGDPFLIDLHIYNRILLELHATSPHENSNIPSPRKGTKQPNLTKATLLLVFEMYLVTVVVFVHQLIFLNVNGSVHWGFVRNKRNGKRALPENKNDKSVDLFVCQLFYAP